MANIYGIARLDLVSGHSLSYDFDAAIENGLWVEENYANGKVVVTTDVTKKQKFVASVANLYDSVDESDFRNEVGGMKLRAYDLPLNDIVTTTQIDYTAGRANFAAIVVGDYAYPSVGGKTQTAAAFPSTGSVPVQKFRVIEKTTLNGKDAIAIKVETA